MKRLKKIGAILISLGIMLGVGSTVYNVYARTSWTESGIKAEYELLSEFTVPEREVSVKGTQVKADAVVQLPDGTATKAETIKLKTAGLYTIIYTADVEGKRYVEEETFIVHNNLYSFTSEESSATWGKYQYAKDTEGLMVRLAEGDTFTLNQPVDLTALREEEWLLQAFATPDTKGHADFFKLCFQFTDVNDPNTTLYISARGAGWDETLPYTYYVAGGNDQIPKGFEVSNGKLHEESSGAGAVGWHGFGLGSELCAEYCDEQTMDFRVDFSTMEIITKEGVVTDLDLAEHHDTVWEGFPSGQAYLTIWADIYAAKTANFCLFKVGDVDLKQEKVIDNEPPTITIDTKYKEMPQAVKGGCYQYIPKATARDLTSGECEVTTKVYYNYQSPGTMILDAKNGTFATERFGYYAIVYEATDMFGNLGREILWVKAEKSLKKPSITLKEKPISQWIVGEKFIPQEYTYKCYSGEPTVNVYATKGQKTHNLNNGFRLEEEGTYTITYELKDCAGQIATYEYELAAKIGDKPVLGQDVVMPDYMITGTEYTFPQVYFNDYRSGKKERKVATGKIIDANGEQEVEAGDTYELSVNNSGDMVSVVFECENASYKVEIPTVKSWGQIDGRSAILVENYFIGSGFSCKKGDGIIFKATEAEGGWLFANPLLADNFVATIQGVKKKTDYESLVISMEDSKNREETLTVELPYTPGIFSVRVGEKTQILKKGIDLATAGPISIELKDGELFVAGAKIRNIDFSGFQTDTLYFSMKFKGAGENAAFNLLSLNNHAMGSSKTDKIAPQIIVRGDYGGSYKYEDEIVLPSAVTGDVLNPNITFTMTVLCGKEVVKDMDGTVLKDVDPTKEYTIKADKFGKYNVVYTAYDSFSEKDETLSYVIHITDDVAPTIKFSQKLSKEAKVGDTICIPKYKVSDNVTDEKEITVMKYVQDPNGTLIPLLGESNAIIASKAGTYKFMVLVIDKESNVCNESWIVTVTEN